MRGIGIKIADNDLKGEMEICELGIKNSGGRCRYFIKSEGDHGTALRET